MMRSHYCGQLNESLDGQEITLCGWVHRRRDHGGVIFLDIRDREGLAQVVFDPDRAETFATMIDGRMGTIAQQAITAAELISSDPRNADRASEILRATIATNRDIYGMCIAYEPVEMPKGGKKFFAPY